MQEIPPSSGASHGYNSRSDFLDQLGIYFLRDIDDVQAERFSKTMLVIASIFKREPGRRITVYINSGGGSVGAGFAMIETIFRIKREYGVPVDTVILGYAYSMGAIISQAGDNRSMGFFSTMMLHSSSWTILGDDQKIFSDYQKLSKLYQSRIGELFHRRTKMHSVSWWTRFIYSGRDRFLSSAECLDLKLVDEVCAFDTCYIVDESV